MWKWCIQATYYIGISIIERKEEALLECLYCIISKDCLGILFKILRYISQGIGR